MQLALNVQELQSDALYILITPSREVGLDDGA